VDDSASRSLILWSISDGRAGHLAQSRGLVRSLSELADCTHHEIVVPPATGVIAGLLTGSARFADSLPDPDLIIGAGHRTHLPLICARRARGGRSLVLMRPSLPLALFDFCLIPSHDDPPSTANVIVTRGPLNDVRPAATRAPGTGLILIGGPSRHYRWDGDSLLQQIRTITAQQDLDWLICDSPRTPAATRRALTAFGPAHRPFDRCPPGWLGGQMARAGTIWISRDSMAMIFESLSAGAAVGLLDVPARGESRLGRAADALAAEGLATAYPDWLAGRPLVAPPVPLSEARRCAAQVLDRLRQRP